MRAARAAPQGELAAHAGGAAASKAVVRTGGQPQNSQAHDLSTKHRSTREAGSSPSQYSRRTSSASTGVSSWTVALRGCTSPARSTQTASRSSYDSRGRSFSNPRALASKEYAADEPRSSDKVSKSLPALFCQDDQTLLGTRSTMTSASDAVSSFTTARKALARSSASSGNETAGASSGVVSGA